jgi:hypothetical protein
VAKAERARNKHFDGLYASTIYPAGAFHPTVLPAKDQAIPMINLGMFFLLETEEQTIQRFFGCMPRTLEVVHPPVREPMRLSGHSENEERVRRYARGHRSIWNLGRKPELWFEGLRKSAKRRAPAFALAVYDHQEELFVPNPPEAIQRFGDSEKTVLRYRDHLKLERDFLRLEAHA